MFMVLLVFAVVIIGAKWSGRRLVDTALIVGIISATLAGMAWAAKEAVSALYRRIQFSILNYLSDGKPHSREEIKALGKRVRGSIYLDALADLVLEGKVVVENGEYRVPR